MTYPVMANIATHIQSEKGNWKKVQWVADEFFVAYHNAMVLIQRSQGWYTHTHTFFSKYRKLILVQVSLMRWYPSSMSVRWCPHDALLCTLEAERELNKMTHKMLRRHKRKMRENTRNFDHITGEGKKRYGCRFYPLTEVFDLEGLYISEDKFKKSRKQWSDDLINHKRYWCDFGSAKSSHGFNWICLMKFDAVQLQPFCWSRPYSASRHTYFRWFKKGRLQSTWTILEKISSWYLRRLWMTQHKSRGIPNNHSHLPYPSFLLTLRLWRHQCWWRVEGSTRDLGESTKPSSLQNLTFGYDFNKVLESFPAGDLHRQTFLGCCKAIFTSHIYIWIYYT